MSTQDDWERWLHLGGASDELDDTAHGDRADGSGTGPVSSAIEIDDPWGAIEVELTPLTDAQREHLRLAAPTVLDELVELGRGDASPTGSPDRAAEVSLEVSLEVSDELTAAFESLDAIDAHDDEG
jgi:hypothetical protein